MPTATLPCFRNPVPLQFASPFSLGLAARCVHASAKRDRSSEELGYMLASDCVVNAVIGKVKFSGPVSKCTIQTQPATAIRPQGNQRVQDDEMGFPCSRPKTGNINAKSQNQRDYREHETDQHDYRSDSKKNDSHRFHHVDSLFRCLNLVGNAFASRSLRGTTANWLHVGIN